MTNSPDAWWTPALRHGGVAALIHSQDHVVSRVQWLSAGGSVVEIRRLLRRLEWRVLFPGVYATDPASITKMSRSIAALLYAGSGGAWSHVTASEQWRLVRPDVDDWVDVLLPAERRVRRQPGLRLHYSRAAERRRAPGVLPPRVSACHAVLDRVAGCRSLDSALAVVADSCQTRRVRLDDVVAALGDRRVRWGRELKAAVRHLDGSDSLLEVRYVRNVESAHRLPAAPGSESRAARSPTARTTTSTSWSSSTDGRTWKPAAAGET